MADYGRSPGGSGSRPSDRASKAVSPVPASIPSAGGLYQAGNALFRDLRCFLELGGVDPSGCKLVIQFPSPEARRTLVKRLQASAAPAPPMSGAKLGNFGGTWQGVSYELRVPQ